MKLPISFTKKNITIGAAIIMFLSAGFWFYHNSNYSEVTSSEISYTKNRVSQGDIIVDLYSDGTVDFEKVNLQFEISGQLKEILIKNNQDITTGDIIARINDREYQEEYLIALSNYQESITNTSKNYNVTRENCLLQKTTIGKCKVNLK
jgi:multidrug efflux pump subunit AcrA (membrane-fusion protein)